jgi:hypothetical protein
MEIYITDTDKTNKEVKFSFTDDFLDNDNFVEFYSEDELVVTFSLDELISIVKAFEEKRKQKLTRDNLLK